MQYITEDKDEILAHSCGFNRKDWLNINPFVILASDEVYNYFIIVFYSGEVCSTFVITVRLTIPLYYYGEVNNVIIYYSGEVYNPFIIVCYIGEVYSPFVIVCYMC